MFCPICGGAIDTPNYCIHCGRTLLSRLTEDPEIASRALASRAMARAARVGLPTRKWLIACAAGCAAIVATALIVTFPPQALSNNKTPLPGEPTQHESGPKKPLPKGAEYIAAVRNSVLRSRPHAPIGNMLERSFTNYKWTTGQTASGVSYVEFKGRNIETYNRMRNEVDQGCKPQDSSYCRDLPSEAHATFRFVLSDDGTYAMIYDLRWPLFDTWTNSVELAVSYIYK